MSAAVTENPGSDGSTPVPYAPKARRRIVAAFLRAPSGVIALIVVALLLLDAVFAPIFLKSAAETVNVDAQNQSPSWSHLLGTDQVLSAIAAGEPSEIVNAVTLGRGSGCPQRLAPGQATQLARGVVANAEAGERISSCECF